MTFRNEQEAFWAGDFGDQYVDRNQSDAILTGNIELFAKMIPRTCDVQNVIEFGANIGLNLRALKTLLPNLQCSAVEINEQAVAALKQYNWIDVHHQPICHYQPKQKFDLVLVKGVLIHINPDDLKQVYSLLYQSAAKYIAIVEYYNPTPVNVRYRGNENKLFKRDFAGEMLDTFPDLRLIDYGFCYHRDPYFPRDDMNWFLLGQKKIA